MTSVEIRYNPFKVKTEIKVDGNEIAKTSNLYRYRNTPLEDWIEVFIPELVEYCNDDEISLCIISVQKYIDDINDQIKVYSKKHRHVDIEVKENASTGYKGRLSKISQIQERLGDSFIIDESKLDIQILMVSMDNSEEYGRMLEVVTGTKLNPKAGYIISNFKYAEEGFENIDILFGELDERYINIAMYIFPNLDECSNKYWRLLKEKVTQSDNHMLVACLNGKPKMNDELYGYISEKLEKKGKQSRSRYIFISNNAEENDMYLRDEYGVRNISILKEDDVDEILRMVKKYIQNVCYVNKIVNKANIIKEYLEEIQTNIAQAAERNKGLEILERERGNYKNKAKLLMEHYNSLTLIQNTAMNQSELTENFIEDLTIQLRQLIIKHIVTSSARAMDGEDVNLIIADAFRRAADTLAGKLTPLSTWQYQEDVKFCMKDRMFIHVDEYLKRKYVLKVERMVIDGDFDLENNYSAMILIEEAIDINRVCDNFIDSISGIIKRTESGAKMGFFEWVTENITARDFGIYSLNAYSPFFTTKSSSIDDYLEVDKKIKRRIKTIADEIHTFFYNIVTETDMCVISKLLKEKIVRIENYVESSISEVTSKMEDYERQLDISHEEKDKILGIDEIISELDKTTEI